MIPEFDNFRMIDLLCNTMQSAGHPKTRIEAIVTIIKSMAKSPEQYEQWNRPLEATEVEVMRSFRRPGGRDLAKRALEQFYGAIASHLDVSKDDFLRKAGLN